MAANAVNMSTHNLRSTTVSGATLYLNNDKSSGDIRIDSGSSDSNAYDDGNLIVNNNILI